MLSVVIAAYVAVYKRVRVVVLAIDRSLHVQ